MTLGQKLCALRGDRSLREIAGLCQTISPTTISRMEHDRDFHFSHLLQLLSIYQVSITELLEGTDLNGYAAKPMPLPFDEVEP